MKGLSLKTPLLAYCILLIYPSLIIMKFLNKHSKFIPYLYFIAITVYYFTYYNKTEGIAAYPILIFGIPFIWQLIKPNKKLNFTLGITFVCLSSYLILAYLIDLFSAYHFNTNTQNFMTYGGLLVISNFFMSLWIIKNSLNRSF